MTKRQVIIKPDGTEEVLPLTNSTPGLAALKKIVEGHIELVRVLRADITDANAYTYMIANETGLIDGLPRNQRATEIYLANVKRAYPDHPNPSKAAHDDMAARYPPGTVIHNFNPEGYEDDPYIAGTVLWFDGYTCDELLRMGL